ncbi:His-Xaa-Ser system-associated MauG-like protein [Phaeobacter gallaeciensis]|uniref:His-Xaa-Ser system-associated MauG-like protein n=1 Tax=Phaeobacter gallaeciensis TaxID=60890 RepID=UPI00237F5AFA|nr:His-Xaa-Ser system-associated MauG-like protein [Phaeobacter gallaeciensis]MDE4099722.1 His-Xaa-Ser system-associated MauG-like protein [Phaeobacter gallaeciensis]MDE4108543.1 His-Xaa-Ser system-associated MauG-like protein [Phaeobacter gallaeciensis]MDE4110441.1 His-Xaa-Ser system-associated MauG-like protein [Phaeobacter gallaeciensis]MDE4117363.1 His-Xaa-Ser system-associated MauG-like protein [Phaeobacter gallaeciensis]MDE4121837.1 His-Xaa-Ser system-associated MauG-like protein [Phaeob
MKFATKLLCTLVLTLSVPAAAETMREAVLRQAALDNGLSRSEALWPEFNPAKAAIGERLFESELLSLTRNVSCRSCHLDEFGSADGLPLGHGAGGVGVGVERMKSPAGLLSRNALALWGRGGAGFDVFFWDGRVDGSSGSVQSQFGALVPSDDPLVVAAHLPTVEFREMIGESDATEWLRQGDVEAAQQVHQEIARRIRATPEIAKPMADAFDVDIAELDYLQVAEALAAFIRVEFRLRDTKLHRFVFDGEDLSESELAGGLIFYGRGQCAACHSGPYFSDLNFHAVPFPQFGFGFNGFGIDYGRYNFTQDPRDLYTFRTPPLFNVTKTAPYSHSGAEPDLAKAIRTHVDPLAEIDTSALSPLDRAEIYQRIARWSQEPVYSVELSTQEISDIVDFLSALDFDPEAER